MKKITFHFFSGSPLIKLRFGTPITHVGVEFDDGMYMESLMLKGNIKTHIKNKKTKPVKSITIEVDEASYVKARGKANNIVGKKYDHLAILGFIVGIKLQEDNGFFCSELGRVVYEAATGNKIDLLRLCTPYDLFLVLDTYRQA